MIKTQRLFDEANKIQNGFATTYRLFYYRQSSSLHAYILVVKNIEIDKAM